MLDLFPGTGQQKTPMLEAQARRQSDCFISSLAASLRIRFTTERLLFPTGHGGLDAGLC